MKLEDVRDENSRYIGYSGKLKEPNSSQIGEQVSSWSGMGTNPFYMGKGDYHGWLKPISAKPAQAEKIWGKAETIIFGVDAGFGDAWTSDTKAGAEMARLEVSGREAGPSAVAKAKAINVRAPDNEPGIQEQWGEEFEIWKR